VIKEYVHFSTRPGHTRGIERKIPEGNTSERKEERKGRTIAFPILNGWHYD
jgi:hypothetical protein